MNIILCKSSLTKTERKEIEKENAGSSDHYNSVCNSTKKFFIILASSQNEKI